MTDSEREHHQAVFLLQMRVQHAFGREREQEGSFGNPLSVNSTPETARSRVPAP